MQENRKRERLTKLLQKYPKPPILIFVNQRNDTETLASFLKKQGFNADALHGSKSQDKRELALNSLKDGRVDILVCTGVAGRGLDIEGVQHVINYHAPPDIVEYIHRIGRTGRAGKKGIATTFITKDDEAIFYDLNKFLEDNN